MDCTRSTAPGAGEPPPLRNHSFLLPLTDPPWLHVEAFLYLSDVHGGRAPTHLVSLRGYAVTAAERTLEPDRRPGTL